MRERCRVPEAEVRAPAQRDHRKLWLRLYEFAVTTPLLLFIGRCIFLNPGMFDDPQILVWMAAIATVDLLPVPTTVSSVAFSLSFPLELSVALLYPTPVAALIAFVGSSDPRELKRDLSFMKAVWNRSQVAVTVLCESAIFKAVATLDSPWWLLGLAVLLAAVAGYCVNIFFVSTYGALQDRVRPIEILRDIHNGVFGEFVLSYMGLALFSVLVATTFQKIGILSIFVFIAPLAFARQMFTRTHSLAEATEELAVKQAENEYQALHDSLTGLPNRMLFQQRLADAIDAAREREGRIAVMLMDLDHFKEVNDTLGHHFGDMLLKEIGPRLSTVLREEDMMARLGGDEFGVLLPDLPDDQVAFSIAERLLEELEVPVSVEGLALDVSGSIGLAIFPTQSQNAESLLRRADVAMYAAKEGGGGYELYAPTMDQNNPTRLTLVSQVRPAIEREEFEMYYQPKVRLSDGRVAGAEALIRWHHPERGMVPPDEFIPLVEKTVLLGPLTTYVMEHVMRQWRAWADDGTPIPLAINLSPRSLLDRQLPETVSRMLDQYDVPPSYMRMELTESFLMADSGRSHAVLDELANIGISLSIDDFGTGYSSLSHLKRLPVDEIKIDRSFVMDMQTDNNDLMIVRATVDLGKNMGLKVVAEGVEDRETFDQLADFGCDEAQGFYISRPMPLDDFTMWLSVRTPEA
ncbi:MAG: EAL domain-containing protein, partial [Actinomycetota bacterium]|nr:EAL domain-containing protein [Actinomycetota bacterium]